MATGTADVVARAQAIRMTGTVVHVSPSAFLALVGRGDAPLIVCAEATRIFVAMGWEYVSPYRGLVLYTKSPDRLELPASAEVIEAESIAVPW